MDFSKLLNQVLSVAKETASSTMQGNSTTDKVTKIGGGAAAIGLLSMVLGKKGGSNLAKLGSLAALGGLAYQAYQKYQANNAQQTAALPEATFGQYPEQTSQLILQAMIAAAHADGLISEQEKQAILSEAGNDPELLQWVQSQLNQPVSVAQLAQQVGNNQALAAQVYLAARMVCQDLDRKEIIFLANLAEALNLADAFVEQLEKQAGF